MRRRTVRIRRRFLARADDLRGTPIHCWQYLPPLWPQMCGPLRHR